MEEMVPCFTKCTGRKQNWKPLTAAVTISQTNGGVHFLVVIVIMYLRQNKGPRNGMMETCVNYNQIPSPHGPF